jgi:nitrogen regulatory protein PII
MDSNSQFSLIITIVDRGCGDDVMSFAKDAGAGGGTIIYGRGTGAKEAAKFFNIVIQEEKELVLIAVKVEQKQAIMSAITKNAGLATSCHGVTFSLPIEDVAGFKWKSETPNQTESE